MAGVALPLEQAVAAAPPRDPLPAAFAGWFAGRGWTPHRHQLAMLAAARAGESALLLIAPTGGGKTLAGFLPSLVELSRPGADPGAGAGRHTLYISPLKALAVDIHRNLEQPIAEMGLPVRAESRTGDTPAAKRQRQRRYPAAAVDDDAGKPGADALLHRCGPGVRRLG